jgi:hypothetical protein
VEERGRRLVTIDTRTGQEYGADNGLSRSPIPSSPIAPPPQPSVPKRQHSALSALVVKATGNAGTPSTKPAQSGTNPGLAGKLIVLVAACLFLTAFLIMTNLWPFVVVPLAIPQVRATVVTQGKAMLKKFLDQAATG